MVLHEHFYFCNYFFLLIVPFMSFYPDFSLVLCRLIILVIPKIFKFLAFSLEFQKFFLSLEHFFSQQVRTIYGKNIRPHWIYGTKKLFAQRSKGQIKPKAVWARHKFSQKTNEQICFVRSFFGRIYGAPICFRFFLTFNID